MVSWSSSTFGSPTADGLGCSIPLVYASRSWRLASVGLIPKNFVAGIDKPQSIPLLFFRSIEQERACRYELSTRNRMQMPATFLVFSIQYTFCVCSTIVFLRVPSVSVSVVFHVLGT